ncbi:MAG: PASTA domain-containing protein, partial [Clostridia bacterium]|nr:PASTA domain-containing protein [Clostridia bacterium]
EKDFDFIVEAVSNSSYEDGTVFLQTPASGTKVKPENNVITLSVADNAQELVVPDVIGYQHDLAKETLESKGFKVQSLPILNLVEDFGTVIKTEPDANTEVSIDTTITIYFASDEDLIQVPDNAVGWDIEMAKAIIESVGLTVDDEIIYENSSENSGVVIRTEPEAGEKVIQGSKVKLVASNGIPEVGTATLTLNLPSSGSTRGNFEVFVNNESYITKTLLMDGKEYSTEIQGSGSDVSVKVYIDDKEYYTCTVDFTKNPAVISDGVYSSSVMPSTRKAMPSVTGLSYETAVAQLNALGFHNIKKEEQIVASPNEVNKVLSQSPSASTQGILGVTTTYPLDTEIVLTVGKSFGL